MCCASTKARSIPDSYSPRPSSVWTTRAIAPSSAASLRAQSNPIPNRIDDMTWSPTSWQTKPAQQQALYGDTAAVARVVDEMGRLPPLVTSWEVERLRDSLAHATIGNAFVLQGGDCAESFDDCRADPIAAKLKI